MEMTHACVPWAAHSRTLLVHEEAALGAGRGRRSHPCQAPVPAVKWFRSGS